MTTVLPEDLWCLENGTKRFCNKGLRKWCVENGVDYDTFLREGLPEEVLGQHKDPRMTLVILKAKQREGREA